MKSSPPLVEDCRTQQSTAGDYLQPTDQSEQQLDAELTAPEETETHRQAALCCLLSKLSVLEELKDEADEACRQMDTQKEENRRNKRETEELEKTTTDTGHHRPTTCGRCPLLLSMSELPVSS
ncbi:hypothetical protein PAMP_021695 [Pampus punctatissimus]